jgi:hypothetical protein
MANFTFSFYFYLTGSNPKGLLFIFFIYCLALGEGNRRFKQVTSTSQDMVVRMLIDYDNS